MKPTLILILVLLSGSGIYAQAGAEPGQPTGKAIDAVVTRADATQSYAAYVPTTYSAKTPSALIYCFDPLARAKFALERFVAAAEKYGYIVVCSNNSHNGQENAAATHLIAALEDDVRHRFNIDPARVYVAGFSGGARLAISLAVTCGKCVAGVLAAGAGFPPNIKPDSKLPFAFFGAVGVDDFNYGELRDLQAKLQSLPGYYHIETFAGRHEWMDQATTEQALAWFNLRAMKNGSLARNDAFIADQFAARRTTAEHLFAESHVVDAYYSYLSLLRDFGDHAGLEPLRTMSTRIANSAGYKKEVRLDSDLADRQKRATGELFSLWLRVPDPAEDLTDTKPQVRERIAKLQKANDLPDDSPDRRLARRTLFGTFVGAIETGRSLVNEKKYVLAAAHYELALVVRPRDQGLAFELARIYALDGKKKQALQALEDAVTFGYNDRDRLRPDVAFANLSKDSRFLKLVNQTP
jgi:predicted esterase